MRALLLLPCFLLLVGDVSHASVVLGFDSPVPGTIADKDGLGTGFTHRLPRTGGSLPTNDPNLDLSSVPGSLLITSTRSDINHVVDLGIAEAPAIVVSGLDTGDISISIIVRDMPVQQGSDQLGIVVGTSSTGETARALLHEGGVYVLSENWVGTGFTDSNTITSLNAFATGDDIRLTMSRINGLWGMSWDNLTSADPDRDGSIASRSLPWLDASPDLYVGIYAANAGNFVPKTYQVDEFRLDVVPEASSIIAWALTLLGVSLVYGFRRRSRSS